MTRIAFISDIHGNLEALNAVLKDIRHRDIENVLCLGDVAGFNADQENCMQLLVDEGVQWIAGNHDLMACSSLTPLACSADARFAATKACRHLGIRWKKYIRNLPLVMRDEVFVAFHASPNRVDEYLVSRESLCNAVQALAMSNFPNIAFFGHTHKARIYTSFGDKIEVLSGSRVQLEKGKRYLVNVGTVGEPRDRNRMASYVIFDMAGLMVEHIGLSYDFERSRQKSVSGFWRRPEGIAPSSVLDLLEVKLMRLRHRVWPREEDDSTLAGLARRLARREVVDRFIGR